MKKRIRIILADSHAVAREALREVFAADPAVSVVAEARTACEVLHLLAEKQPDVLVSDLQMPGLTCQELLRSVKSGFPEVGILVLSLFVDEPYVAALHRAGADACLPKQADVKELVGQIKAVASVYEFHEVEPE